MTVTLKEFYAEVAGKADTEGTKINAAETSRVLSEAFLILQQMDPAQALDLILKGLAGAKKKLAKG